eukprot:CAMPEP_0116029078 /NCGR_PEP_ID=MMETSP0321-20121206/15883_1 /TAXON_ID=163516 /ORGANISM="Leptocylindrus danicus var. danicus, Strain B650" /LENGTH=45 /DNA_ID= /DNA_START= /DNA_END= /DNA_ORIENTATION=
MTIPPSISATDYIYLHNSMDAAVEDNNEDAIERSTEPRIIYYRKV